MTVNSSVPAIAILAANGIDENNMTEIQRSLARVGWRAKVISPENGLIHSWAHNAWGHCYPADAKLEVSLGSDFDMLILPHGTRNADRLKTNAHTKRFITAFLLARKPVAAFGSAEDLLKICEDAYQAGSDNILMNPDYAEAMAVNCEAMVAFFQEMGIIEEEQQAA